MHTGPPLSFPLLSYPGPVHRLLAGPAFLQFDLLKAGLSMDLPVLVWICQSSYIPIRRPASNFFQDREGIVQLFMSLEIFYFKASRENFTGLLFCLDLSLSRSTDHRDRNLHSLSHRFQSSCSWVRQLGLLYFIILFECKHVKSYSVP